MKIKFALVTALVGVLALSACGSGDTGSDTDDGSASDVLPAKFANDPVAKLVGAKVFNAALKEKVLDWYGGTSAEEFIKSGMDKVFKDRFGIEVRLLSGTLDELAARVLTESAIGSPTADAVYFNDIYMFQFYNAGILEKWQTNAPTLKEFPPDVNIGDPAGYMTPLDLSVQGILVNTDKVPPDQRPKSYKDLLDPKWKGKIRLGDPTKAGATAWQVLQMENVPSLGKEYFQQLHDVVQPFTGEGKSQEALSSVATGRFDIGFGGRPENLTDSPNAPIAYIVPEEGLAWSARYISVLKDADAPDAAKVFTTWLYEQQNLEKFSERGRPVPIKGIKVPIPEMDLGRYKLMPRTPDVQLKDPTGFFEEQEKLWK